MLSQDSLQLQVGLRSKMYAVAKFEHNPASELSDISHVMIFFHFLTLICDVRLDY